MKMHCKHGHRFTKENTYNRPDGARGCRRCLNKSVAKYRKVSSEKAKATAARGRVKNREKRNAYSRKYCKEHPEKYTAYRNKRRALKTQAGGTYTSAQWKRMCKFYGNVCLCCRKKKKLTPDHVMPIALGGTNDISNIQPLCLKCNMHKHTGTTDYRNITQKRTHNGSNMQ
jgi:hypothetical protein